MSSEVSAIAHRAPDCSALARDNTERDTTYMKDTIFAKIISGDVPCFKIYEDERTLTFLDINPVARGHTLVIPKHTEANNIFDISPEDWSAVSETVRIVAIALEQALDADGVNLIMNNRENAGQVIFHPHVHLIPRFKNDGLRHWPHGSYKASEAEVVQQKIISAMR